MRFYNVSAHVQCYFHPAFKEAGDSISLTDIDACKCRPLSLH